MDSLLKKGMSELHQPRIIKSCYFDNSIFSSYHDSEEGVVPRKKVRIRWYNNTFSFIKETKFSSVEGRYKYSEKIRDISTPIDILKLNYFDNHYGHLSPKLNITYQREYYLYKNLRITFDQNINYSLINSKVINSVYDNECVMEVKVPIDFNDDIIEKIIYQPTTRFSKYSRGLLLTKLL